MGLYNYILKLSTWQLYNIKYGVIYCIKVGNNSHLDYCNNQTHMFQHILEELP